MSRHWFELATEGTLEMRRRYFVEVGRFTFRFETLEMLKEYSVFFNQKIRPSSRANIRDGLGAWLREQSIAQWRDVDELARVYRETRYGFRCAKRYYMQTPFEKLPMYLLKDKNRLRVVNALKAALEAFA